MAHGYDGDATLGLAGTAQRIYFGFPAIVVALRRAGDSRASGRIAHDHYPDLGALSVSTPPGYGGSVFCAVTFGDDGFARRAKKNPRTKGFQYGRRQRGAATIDQSRKRTNAGAGLRFRHFVTFGVSALLDSAQGSALAGLGSAAYLGQFHAQEFFLRIFRIRRYAASNLQYFQTGTADRNHRHFARDVDRLYYQS